MGLWQVYTLFSKVFTDCNNLPLDVLSLAGFQILKSSLFHSVIVNKIIFLTLTKEMLFLFLEKYLLVAIELISLKDLGAILFNICND